MPNTVIQKIRKWFCNLLALLILFQIGLGWYMTGLTFYHRWYHSAPALHKSMGLVILLMTMIRLSFRLKEGLPKAELIFQSLKFNIFGLQHYFLYAFLILIAMAGYLFATSKGDPVPFFGLINFPSFVTTGDALGNFLDVLHSLLAYTLAGGILVHSFQMLRRLIRNKR